MSTTYDSEDAARLRFLDNLSRSSLPVTVGEAQFIENLGEAEEFTLIERARIDRMRARYGPEFAKRK